jgi:hypothetical protein
MKNLLPLVILVVLSSCAANKRGGYHKLPPLENRFGRQMYWKKERSHGQINPQQNTIATFAISEG